MAKLIPMVLDFETFFSQEHSLTKMNPLSYIMHPDTEIISCSAKTNGHETFVAFGEDNIRQQMQAWDWSDKIVIAHNNAGFDAAILKWRFNINPAMFADTLAMARPIHAKTTGLSLAKLVEHYGLGKKDQTALMNTKGRHLKDFTPGEIEAMGVYNKADVDQCWGLFQKLLPLTSKREMKLIDMTIRMLTEPGFELDIPLLEKTLVEERARKKETLVNLARMTGAYEPGMTDEEAADAVCTTLGSAAKFGKLLTDLGVEVPTKISPTTKKVAPALAKTDEAFIALTKSSDPIVAAAANARLGVKSTLLESRISTFLEVGRACNGKKPIAINYYGADTTGRDSGGMSMNDQNLPRVSPGKPKPTDALRMSLRAPKGMKVVVADLSGIELRTNMFLWQVPYAMKLFQDSPDKADLYRYFAANDLYGIAEDEVTKDQRQVGKVAHLGLGFGAGGPTFQRIAKMMGGIDMSLDDSTATVGIYRGAHQEIAGPKGGWKSCGTAIKMISEGLSYQIDPWGMCWTTAEGIKTPQGMIRYPDLRQEEVIRNEGTQFEKTEMAWVYGRGRHRAFLSGPKVTENIVQHLAREVVMDNALEIKRVTGYGTKHRVHDELIYVVPDSEADDMLATVQGIMRTPPKWWPELITWSEGSYADTYGEAK